MAYEEPKCDPNNRIGYEEDKATRAKNLMAGPKSRTHWSFCDMEQDDWDQIFKGK